MKIRVLVGVITASFLAFAVADAADNEKGIGGKWLTDAVRNAKPDIRSDSVISRIIQGAGDVAVQNAPTGGGRGPGRMGPGGRSPQIDTSAPVVVEKGSSPDGAALILELKLNKTKLTGQVMEVVSGAKFDVEEAKVTGNKFEFKTYKKVLSAKIATVYKGELVDESTISLTRLSDYGKAVDLNEDGSPQALIFRRSK